MIRSDATLDQIIDEGRPDELCTVAQKLYNSSVTARKPHEDRWLAAWRRYRLIRDKPSNWTSDLTIPLGWSAVEATAPRLVAKTPRWICQPRTPAAVDIAKSMEKWAAWICEESVTQYRSKMRLGIKNSLLCGSGILKTYYDYEARNISVRTPNVMDVSLGPDGHRVDPDWSVSGRVKTEQTIVVKDHPNFACVHPLDFFPDPMGTSIDDCEFVMHRALVPMRVVRDMVDSGEWEERILDDLERHWWSNSQDSDARARLSAELGEDMEVTGGMAEYIRPVEVWEFWIEPGLRMTILDREVMANESQEGRTNPFNHQQKPFVKFDDHEVDGQFWGVSTMSQTESLQFEIDSLRNQRNDAARMSLSPAFMVRKGHLNYAQWLVRPGVIIPVDSVLPLDDIVMPLPSPPVAMSGYEEVKFLMEVFSETTGLTDYSRGKDAPTRDTATETDAKQEGENARFALQGEALDAALERLMDHHLSNAAQFMDSPRKVPSGQFTPGGEGVGAGSFENFIEVTPADFVQDFRVSVKPASGQETDDQRRVQSLQLLEVMTGNPDIAQLLGPEGTKRLATNVMESFGIIDADSYFQGQPAPPPGMEGPPGLPPGEGAPPEGMPPEMAGMMGGAPPGGPPPPGPGGMGAPPPPPPGAPLPGMPPEMPPGMPMPMPLPEFPEPKGPPPPSPFPPNGMIPAGVR
jgi:hypothetical protein